MDLRAGRYQDVLQDVECDLVCADPPYSSRTHDGHCPDGNDGQERRPLSYTAWGDGDTDEFVAFWAPRNRGWFVCLSDSDLCMAWRAAFERHGLTGFAPVAIMIPGMTVRLCGDGPSSWTIYANVARPKALAKWGTLPGGYRGPQGEREHIGGKPLWLMRALVRDYSKPGDLVCDPCAGAATTLLAAVTERRRAVGAEVDLGTHAARSARLARGYTPDLFAGLG